VRPEKVVSLPPLFDEHFGLEHRVKGLANGTSGSMARLMGNSLSGRGQDRFGARVVLQALGQTLPDD